MKYNLIKLPDYSNVYKKNYSLKSTTISVMTLTKIKITKIIYIFIATIFLFNYDYLLIKTKKRQVWKKTIINIRKFPKYFGEKKYLKKQLYC